MVAPLSSSALPRALQCSPEERAALPHGVAQITVVGSLNMEVVMRMARTPHAGETVLADAMQHLPGGKGGNQAVACVRHGAQVVLLASVGRDHPGNSVRLALHAAGIDVDHVQVHEGVSTGMAVVWVEPHGDRRVCVAPGANALLQLDTDTLLNVLAPSDFVVLQLETPLPLLQQVLDAAHTTGCRVVLNASPVQPVPAAWWPQIHTLVVNAHEAGAYSHMPVSSLDEASRVARHLVGLGVQHAVVTLGAQGAVAAWRATACNVAGAAGNGGSMESASGQHSVHVSQHRAWPALTVEASGAGDAFLGAMVTRLAESCTLPQAVEWGMAAASLCVGQADGLCAMPTRAAVEEALQAMQGIARTA